MKNYLLLLCLILSARVQAQTSFLESIKSDLATPSEQVFAQVAEWAKVPSHYLSLGESHMESDTVHPINFKIAKIFIDNLKNKYTFCSETISDFLDSAEGQDLQTGAAKVLIFTGNGAAKTDFKNCTWKSKHSAITYSGFYHQYPFAKAWPADFPISPVTAEPDNNIARQLLPKAGLFVTQIELSYLEFLTTRNFLNHAGLDATAFRKRVAAVAANVQQLKTSMELQYGDAADAYKNKFGLFLAKKALTENVSMPEKAWFLVTSRGYNLAPASLRFLNLMAALENTQLTAFLKKLSSLKPYYISMMFGPDQNGQRVKSTYGGAELDGESEVLEIQGHLVVVDLTSTSFTCYQKEQARAAAQIVSCDGIIF